MCDLCQTTSMKGASSLIISDHMCRLPHNDLLRPHSIALMQAALNVLNTDNEENGLLCLRITFDLHKAFRPSLEDLVPPFMEFVKKARRHPQNQPL